MLITQISYMFRTAPRFSIQLVNFPGYPPENHHAEYQPGGDPDEVADNISGVEGPPRDDQLVRFISKSKDEKRDCQDHVFTR